MVGRKDSVKDPVVKKVISGDEGMYGDVKEILNIMQEAIQEIPKITNMTFYQMG